MQYSDVVLKHFHAPLHVGELSCAQDNVVTGRAGSHSCGNRVQLQFLVDDAGVVRDAKFKAYGNPYTIAACDYVASEMIGRSVETLGALTHEKLVKALTIPPTRLGSALIVEDALKAVVPVGV